MSFASTSELPSSKSRNKLSLLDFTTLAPNNSILAKPYDCTSRRLYNFQMPGNKMCKGILDWFYCKKK
eukprot:m.112282 g.112282  ORF g.112282 m.112282 type:complete len:68 (+) comp9251_c0_seq2:1543-1746(+)